MSLDQKDFDLSSRLYSRKVRLSTVRGCSTTASLSTRPHKYTSSASNRPSSSDTLPAPFTERAANHEDGGGGTEAAGCLCCWFCWSRPCRPLPVATAAIVAVVVLAFVVVVVVPAEQGSKREPWNKCTGRTIGSCSRRLRMTVAIFMGWFLGSTITPHTVGVVFLCVLSRLKTVLPSTSTKPGAPSSSSKSPSSAMYFEAPLAYFGVGADTVNGQERIPHRSWP
mmetsp:Transcript_70412/g.141824  ORF Transcript_70412/g.141824 Transcript_70412/m.141824 type:complete len:224 (+) Transcript_70412:206-877(+)